MAGLPRIIHLDNAKEFHSEAIVRGCQEYAVVALRASRRHGLRLDDRGASSFGGAGASDRVSGI